MSAITTSTWRPAPPDEGIVGGVDEEREISCCGALLEHVTHHRRVGIRDPHRRKHDREGLAPRRRLRGDLRRELQVGKAADGEDRELLAAEERRPPGGRAAARLTATPSRSSVRPAVPSYTSTTVISRLTSSTTPCRTSPEASRISTTSSQPTPPTPPSTRSGPP